MENTLLKATKQIVYTLLGLFLAFVVYANLEPAPMHSYVKPISMTIFKVDGLTSPEQINSVKERVAQYSGVTACGANPVSELVSITFDPDQTSEGSLRKLVKNITGKPVQAAVFKTDGPPSPQCPVPQEYIVAFEKAKYALCFR